MSRRRNRKKRRFGEGEELNPMNGLSNLSDAMLVLALGILVALVVHWNVSIVPSDASAETGITQEQSGGDQMVDSSDAVEFSEDELQDASADASGSGEGMQRMGAVYYDEATGKYYVIEDETDDGSAETDQESQSSSE